MNNASNSSSNRQARRRRNLRTRRLHFLNAVSHDQRAGRGLASSAVGRGRVGGGDVDVDICVSTTSVPLNSSFSSVSSGGVGDVAISADLTSLFECPVCFNYVFPPIFQCLSGHLLCVSCRSKLYSCPICRSPLDNIRNLAMEKLVPTVKFPCKHAAYGCTATLAFTVKTQHEEACECRPYLCPHPSGLCTWQGPFDLVMEHLTISHENITIFEGEDIVYLATDIFQPDTAEWVMVQSCFGHHFIFVMEKYIHNGSEKFYAIVKLIGSEEVAEHFVYRLELNGSGGESLIWKAKSRSLKKGVASAIRSVDSIVISKSMVQLFADNGNLKFNLSISSSE